MRNRRRRSLKSPDQNLDSFLDILTNTVGVLMFISLFVSLIAVEAESIIKTPIVTKEKPGKERTARFFEIRDNKVSYIDSEKVRADIQQLIGNLPNCNKPDFDLNSSVGSGRYLSALNSYKSCRNSRARRLVNFQTKTDYYDVKMVDPQSFSLRYEPNITKTGEAKETLNLPESDFNRVLAELDPTKDYIAFIVRPDSFSAFRTAREQAWTKSFDVGWEPYKTEFPIQFGTGGGGRAIKAQ